MPQNIVDSCVNSGLVSLPDDSGMLNEVEIVFKQSTTNRDYVDRLETLLKTIFIDVRREDDPEPDREPTRPKRSKEDRITRGEDTLPPSPQRNRRSKPTPCASSAKHRTGTRPPRSAAGTRRPTGDGWIRSGNRCRAASDRPTAALAFAEAAAK